MFSEKQFNKLIALGMCISSLIGMYFEVPYAGWMMFVGVMMLM